MELKKLVITKNDANQRIDKYLKKLLVNAPSNFIYKMFRKKDIKVNGKRVNEKYILADGDILEMFLYEDKFKEFTAEKSIYEVEKTFKVLYEDKNILIVSHSGVWKMLYRYINGLSIEDKVEPIGNGEVKLLKQ